jgi:hypothetical protein
MDGMNDRFGECSVMPARMRGLEDESVDDR